MKLHITVLVFIVFAMALTGCGENDMFIAKSVDNTKQQHAAIEERIQMYHPVVNIEGGTQVALVDVLPGESKYAACGACHGSQGGGGVGPKLTGKTADYLTGRLNAYRAGEKVGSQSNMMWAQAGALSDQDIAYLVEYVGTL